MIFFIKSPINVFELKVFIGVDLAFKPTSTYTKKEISDLMLFMIVWKEIWKYALIWLCGKRIVTSSSSIGNHSLQH